jgi:hypothetical protein
VAPDPPERDEDVCPTPKACRENHHREARRAATPQSTARARDVIAQRRNKQADPSTHTVQELCQRFYDGVVNGEHKRPEDYKRYLDRDLASLHDWRISQVRRSDLSDLLAEKRKDGPVAANRLLGIAKQLFAYGVEIGWLNESPRAH